MYFDVVGEDGEVTYHVSAVYEEDGTGTISEANSQMVTVDLQNAAPTAVNLITPDDETVITLTADNVSRYIICCESDYCLIIRCD